MEVDSNNLNSGMTWLMVSDAMDGMMTSVAYGLVTMFATMCKAFIYVLGLAVLVAAVTVLFLGPLTWNYSMLTRWFERCFAPLTMGWRYRLLMQPSLRISRWLLGREIGYLHERFRAAHQTGDMMDGGFGKHLCRSLRISLW